LDAHGSYGVNAAIFSEIFRFAQDEAFIARASFPKTNP
jgi:hypothetical protein